MSTAEIVGAVLVGGALAGGALLSIRMSKQRNKTNSVNIRDVTTLGDVAGRDINKSK